jgi:hypothetical protein
LAFDDAEHAGADAVHILGSSLETLPLIAALEGELGVRAGRASDRRAHLGNPEAPPSA